MHREHTLNSGFASFPGLVIHTESFLWVLGVTDDGPHNQWVYITCAYQCPVSPALSVRIVRYLHARVNTIMSKGSVLDDFANSGLIMFLAHTGHTELGEC